MSTRARSSFAVLLVALGLSGGLAACGGGDDDDGGGSSSTAAVETTAPPAGSGAGGDGSAGGAGGEAGADAAGRSIFSESCANCHTLAAADADGQVGPNLDELRPSVEQVATKVREGGGGMPSFSDSLDPAQIEAVATYVAGAAGS
jgi:sulfite dehydrogenase